ncbi:MAG: ParB/RepB/Spo0J family partition protein [bacterium]|nr:ParB/RepB/Spo0J family partition protein [bacterium]
MNKSILGRGLSSLIPQKNTGAASPNKENEKTEQPKNEAPGVPKADGRIAEKALSASFGRSGTIDSKIKTADESVFYIEVEKIHPNSQQPRRDFDEESLKDLAESIRRHGIIQPLIVTKHEHQTPRGQEVFYELVAGERRLRASKLSGLRHVPVIIRGVTEEQQKLEVALVENLQRHDLGALEEARAFRKLMDTFGLTQQEVSLRVGKSRPSVANAMRLLDLPQEMQKGLSEGKITEGHARALLGLKDVMHQLSLYKDVVEKNLSVREVEDVVREEAVKVGTRKAKEPRVPDPEVREFQTKLADALGTRVHVKGKVSRGKIVVEFYSREELQNIIGKIAGEK